MTQNVNDDINYFWIQYDQITNWMCSKSLCERDIKIKKIIIRAKNNLKSEDPIPDCNTNSA